MSIKRRTFITGAGVGAGAAAASAAIAAAPPAVAAPSDPSTISVPFRGANQSGIYRPSFQQASACFASFRLLTDNATDLENLMRLLSLEIESLQEGSLVNKESETGGQSDDVLGPHVPPDALTVTLGLGAGVFTDKYGLTSKAPRGLTTMPVFSTDTPDPDWTGGDLMLQICSNAPDSVHHALRNITRLTRGAMQLEWKIMGFHSRPRPSGAPRNLFGYADGISNPLETDGLVWIDRSSGQPNWLVGGTFMVVRLIRMLVEFWDRVDLVEQNNMIGRNRDSGAPLDGNKQTDIPNYAADPEGKKIPLDAHIRLANPRTPETAGSRILRRGYNYEMPTMDLNGNSRTGLIFASFQKNIQNQFEANQLRLLNEPMVDYIQPFGGGYFVVPPGVPDGADNYLGMGLFS
jgi:deferrochelatase/peroxidase EfeB